MQSQNKKYKPFARAALALTAAGAATEASAVNLSWSDGTPAADITGHTIYYGTGPIAADCSGNSGSFSAGNVTSVTVPANLFPPNVPYYFAVSANNAAGQSSCSSSSPAVPNPQGPQSAGSWNDTRIAMTVPGVSPAQVYFFTANTLGETTPVTQLSTGGYTPVSYAALETGEARLSISKPGISVIVNEIDIANNLSRQSQTYTPAATTGNVANDTRAYGAESSYGYRLYLTPQGNLSFQDLDQQDFTKALLGPFNTYPSAGANSVTSSGVTTAKIAREVRSDANGTVILSLVYSGGGNNDAVGLWTIPKSQWSNSVSPTDATLPGYIAQTYLPAKQDANGLYNYNSMAVSGGATPALNVAYTQTTSTQVKVVIDQYAGVGYPGSFPAATTGQSPVASCSSAAFTYAAGTTLVRFDVQGDGLGRIWTQNAGNLSYTMTDTSRCNASGGTYALTRPAGVPTNAVLIGNGL